MIFTPQQYAIKDERMQPFIDEQEIWNYIDNTFPSKERVREVIQKSLNKNRLTLQETAVLINATEPELIEEIKEGARILKKRIYGDRIVLFAPLYVGNKCANNCTYCGFRAANTDAQRKSLNDQELIQEIEALEDNGQKRLILVYGEHKEYSPEYIAHNLTTAYSVKKGKGEIRRVNINAAPMEIEGYKTVKEAGIGTFQIFQETYHRATYAKYHISGKKKDYDYRVTGLDRAQEAGLDDVGIGVLFGLYDWRFDLMSLIRHTNHLEACYNVGPHTISFPRLKDAASSEVDPRYLVNDDDFARIIAIIRLAVPYTGLILTARETAALRKEVMAFGVSQIDGGTKIELGAYADAKNGNQNLNKEQFKINDERSLNEIIEELLENDYIPSFCTACYRAGRTGEHFMEFSVDGFIKRFCGPNAILTLTEYILDYAPEKTAQKGWILIDKKLSEMETAKDINEVKSRIERIKKGERDIYF